MKVYTVLVWEYPHEVTVSAESKEEAELIALKRLAMDDFGEVDKVQVKIKK